MSITINLNTDKLKSKSENPKMHYIPAKISDNCTSNVQNYFDNYTKSENNVLTNAFRGFPLKGVEFQVPDNYKGIVLQEKKKPLSEETDREFKAAESFSSFTYWNYDKVPSKFDPLAKSMDWMTISENLAKPVTFEENDFKLWLENNRTKANGEF